MKSESQMILLFGATGDLARRKLIPALYHLVQKNRLTNCTPIVCIGRKKMTKEAFIENLSPEKMIDDANPEVLSDLLRRVEYLHFDHAESSILDFVNGIGEVKQRFSCTANMLIYLALPTTAFQQTVELIGSLSFVDGWRRVVFEKPFGENLVSARQLNQDIRNVLQEDEIYRVDHYLGKELVQNILTLRFANEIFSGAWRSEAIDHIQITVSETLGVEKRAEYYDKSGAVRDMIQNHLMQLLSFLAMEPPQEGAPDGVRDEAVNVLRNLRPLQQDDIVLGQYGSGAIDSRPVVPYTEEVGVKKDSTTETYAAIRAYVDTDRWQGVPFYLRTGKRLRERNADIKIVFRQRRGRHIIQNGGQPNMIIIRIQPDEGIALVFNVQKPGGHDGTETVMMDFCHSCHFGPNTPEAYESILHNVMQGEHSLFPRYDWIDASWQYVDRLRNIALPPVHYHAGSTGPAEADEMLKADGRMWLNEKSAKQNFSIPTFR